MSPNLKLFSRSLAASLCIFFLFNAQLPATTVRFETTSGNIDVELFDDETPITVQNFLNYVDDGDYNGTFIHRAIPGFIIQGGGFRFDNGEANQIDADPPITNEFNRSNLRATLAMAKNASNPDSATNNWFFNLANNSLRLDGQNGGFTVFGEVIGTSMLIVDAIAALPILSAGSPFDTLPVVNYSSGAIQSENLVTITDIKILEDFIAPNTLEINSGMNGSWYQASKSGQGFFIDVSPATQLIFLAWFTYDTRLADESTIAEIGHPGQRWLSALGAYTGNSAELDVNLTSGGLFNDANPVANTPAGTIKLTFSDCENAIIEFDLGQDISGTIPITRLLGDNVDLCKELSVQTSQ